MYGVRPRAVHASRLRRQPTINRASREVAVAARLGLETSLEDHAPALLMSRRPHLMDHASVVALQRYLGNAAMSGLLQRDPDKSKFELSQSQDPEGYTSDKGKSNVQSSGTTRREVHGLKFGLSGGFQESYVSKRHPDGDPSAESKMTAEKPEHMAVVIMPDKLPDDLASRGEVQVILHFAGFGYREKAGDPYAGYTVATGYKRGARDIKKGSVRDVDQEHWEQQIGAVQLERGTNGPVVVAILAQGRGMSDFGDVPTFDYVKDVLSRVPELSGVSKYRVILSGHSGGGYAVGNRVDLVRTRDRSKVPAAKKDHADQQPGDMIVLFDAEDTSAITDWAKNQINAIAQVAKNSKDKPGDVEAAIAATPRYRGYFWDSGSYVTAFTNQHNAFCTALSAVPPEWAYPDPDNPKRITVDDLFRVIPVSGKGVDHEHVISRGPGDGDAAKQGALADALRASTDPTSDRSLGLPCAVPKPKSQPKQSAPDKVERKWTASNAASEYTFTEANKRTLASQTAEERATDLKTLDKPARARLKALAKSEKKGTLSADESKELADLRALDARVEAARQALGRKDVEEVLDAAGLKVKDWYAAVERGTFLGVSLRVHSSLADRLTRAESALVSDAAVNPGKLGAEDLGTSLNMYASTSDLREPKAAIGGKSLSMHTFGLAVDLNYTGNPFLGNASSRIAPPIIQRATSLILNRSIDTMATPTAPKDAYKDLSDASDALKTYLSYRLKANEPDLIDTVGKHARQSGEPADWKGWLKKIQADAKALEGDPDFDGHKSPQEGFMDLNQSVVLALTGAGLTWGGTYPGAKDLMHFDLREGDGAKIDTARAAHVANE